MHATDPYPSPSQTRAVSMSATTSGSAAAMVTINHRHSFNERHKEILAVLSSAGEPLSTSAIRRRVNKIRTTQLVAEQVYRTLHTLHSRGHIQRFTKDGSTEIYWQYAQPVVNDTARRSATDITQQSPGPSQ